MTAWQVDMERVTERIGQLERLCLAGADDAPELALGPPVVLWRRFRDGGETRERLPRWLAELALAAIPECEPQVERAKIERR
jgi:hypothetical protein